MKFKTANLNFIFRISCFFVITEEEREKVFEMDIEISKLQSARERGQLTKEMIEFDKAFEELKKLEM